MVRNAFTGLLVAAALVVGALTAPVTMPSSAQEAAESTPCVVPTPEPEPEVVTSSQRILGSAGFETLPAGPSVMSTIQITLAAGAATQPFTNPGPVLVIVQDGTVTVTADNAVVGLPPEASVGVEIQEAQPAPQPLEAVAVVDGEQIAIPAEATAEFRNDGADPVRLLMITLEPDTNAAAPTAELTAP